jgi:hypothetical protein
MSTAARSVPSCQEAFEALAERQVCAPRKARARAAERRAAEKALRERDQQCAAFHRWHQKRVDELLAGPYGDQARELVAFLATLALDQAPELITLVERSPWRGADPDTRFQILRLIDRGIARVRERAGLAPFDDALPGESPTAFQIIREALA